MYDGVFIPMEFDWIIEEKGPTFILQFILKEMIDIWYFLISGETISMLQNK